MRADVARCGLRRDWSSTSPTFPVLRSLRFALLIAITPAALHAQGATPYDSVAVERNVMMPMRDGLLMATDLYRPVKNGTVAGEPLPVLLNRTPYERETLANSARYFALRGYVVAVQSLRGRHASQGVFLKVQPADATDGFDAIQWYGSVGPAGIPADVVRHLNEAQVAVLEDPDLRERLAVEAVEPMPMTPEQFGQYIRADIQRWTALAKAKNIHLDE